MPIPATEKSIQDQINGLGGPDNKWGLGSVIDDLFTEQKLCVACEGSGKSSRGNECEPCQGTGVQTRNKARERGLDHK